MRTTNLPHAPTRDNPEPPPMGAMLRRLEQSCQERGGVVTATVAALARTLEGRAESSGPVSAEIRERAPRRDVVA